MNDRQFRLNARKLKKEKGFFDIAAHGLPGYVEAYGKRIDAETVWDVVRKSDGYSGEDIRFCACFGAAEDENGRSIAQELANISKKIAAMKAVDAVTGEPIDAMGVYRHDGLCWSTEDFYNFKRYGLVDYGSERSISVFQHFLELVS